MSSNGGTPPGGTKKTGSGEYHAAGPTEETIPAPADAEENIAFQLAEMQVAMQRVGELASELRVTCDRWGLQLTRVKLAMRTSEHRLNVQRAKIIAGGRVLVAHERELRDAKARLDALEVAALRAAAAAPDLEPTTYHEPGGGE